MALASACMDCREGADFAGLAGGGGTRSTAFIVFLDAGTPPPGLATSSGVAHRGVTRAGLDADWLVLSDCSTPPS